MSSKHTRSVRLNIVVVEKLHELKKQLGMSSINDVIILLIKHYEMGGYNGGHQ